MGREAGPRSIHFSKNGKQAYVLCEIMNVVRVYDYSVTDGYPNFDLRQEISTLSDARDPHDAASALRISYDGRYLFCSTAGDDSVACYQIDPQTGALTLDSNVMFSLNEAELTEQGRYTLEEVLPIYCKVLLSDKYADSLAEIMVDGYTDSLGDYATNLLLSQSRAAAVGLFMVQDIRYQYLTEEEGEKLEEYLSVNGHSYSHLIYRDGNEDADASRRVEVKFRLKDEEMIAELDEIMKAGQ